MVESQEHTGESHESNQTPQQETKTEKNQNSQAQETASAKTEDNGQSGLASNTDKQASETKTDRIKLAFDKGELNDSNHHKHLSLVRSIESVFEEAGVSEVVAQKIFDGIREKTTSFSEADDKERVEIQDANRQEYINKHFANGTQNINEYAKTFAKENKLESEIEGLTSNPAFLRILDTMRRTETPVSPYSPVISDGERRKALLAAVRAGDTAAVRNLGYVVN